MRSDRGEAEDGNRTYLLKISLKFGHNVADDNIVPRERPQREALVKQEIQLRLGKWTDLEEVKVFGVEETDALASER